MFWKKKIEKGSGEKKKAGEKRFDPEEYIAVLRCSICNGEQVAGFRSRSTGKFEE